MTRTILITGASSGIGKATAARFAASGWNVVATMRNPADTDLIQTGNLLVTPLDVQETRSIVAAIEAGIARFGRIDALVNNAGFSLFGVFEATPPKTVREQFDVNVFGAMNVTRAILRHFRQNGGGVIVNISSRAGVVGLPLISLYCASKFALEGFSESLAYELASQNIAVKIVEPSGGITSTRFGQRMINEPRGAAIGDYESFVAGTTTLLAGMAASRRTDANEVAQVVYGAATDGSDRLRYFVGEDVGGYVRAKRELSDEEYIRFMRSRFLGAEAREKTKGAERM
jgi:NAD(P)-dependent dehydrogenase (short-subunit alcohol dehydrogenase family)